MRSPVRAQRGYALLVVLGVIVVMMLIVVAGIKLTGQSAAGAGQHKRREAMAACANAARGWVMAQIRPGAQGRAENLKIHGELNTGEYTIRSGHLGAVATASGYPPAVTRCREAATSGLGGDITNITWPEAGGTAQCYRAVVHCINNTTRDATEVEFVLRLSI